MRYYTKTEEWVLIKDGLAYVGLSEHASTELGDIVYVELPQVGDKFSKGEPFWSNWISKGSKWFIHAN